MHFASSYVKSVLELVYFDTFAQFDVHLRRRTRSFQQSCTLRLKNHGIVSHDVVVQLDPGDGGCARRLHHRDIPWPGM